MNYQAIKAIYIFEMSRMRRTLFVSYGSFIVPGLIMLSILTESVSNASFGIYFPKFSGTIYEVLSAPISFIEITIGFVGAAATKSIIVGTIILLTANLFVSITILHPFWMIAFLILTATSFSLLGFILGIWADNWEKLKAGDHHDPNVLEVFCDIHPDEPECLVYDD